MKRMGQQHYSRAPITEAIIDLRVELAANLPVSDLQKARLGQESAYPQVEAVNVAVGQMEFGERVSTAATTKQIGFWFRSSDGKQLYQARLDGFTMNRLAPYESWEPFRTEARRLWDVYRSIAKPKKVVRIALRYVNRLDLPLPVHDFRDYLRTAPEISADLPQNLAGYFMQIAIPQDDIGAVAMLNEALIEPAAPNVASVVLDIDLFRTAELPTSDESLWILFEDLHDRKNDIFEACITDQARELFK
ncbi:MAG: TIGR04255 family protein [Planctomycetes bacterium]|nr:TIGR04255 family protein [Planctomycetota bacterium]